MKLLKGILGSVMAPIGEGNGAAGEGAMGGTISYQESTQRKTASPDKEQGDDFLESGEYRLAIPCYKKAISIYPGYTSAYYNIGCCHIRLEEYGDAIPYFQAVINLEPNYINAHRNLGYLYASLEKYDQAIECYKTVINIDSDYIGAYLYMGQAYAALRQYDRAIECYKNAKAIIDTNYDEVRRGMGRAYDELAKSADAVKNLQCAARLGDTDAQKFLHKRDIGW
jgi:tetratricopeptide (TPR) repeat protein